MFNLTQINYEIHSNMRHDLNEEIPNVINFKFYDTQEFKQLKSKTLISKPSYKHLFTTNFEKLEELPLKINFQFDIIALSETWNSFI